MFIVRPCAHDDSKLQSVVIVSSIHTGVSYYVRCLVNCTTCMFEKLMLKNQEGEIICPYAVSVAFMLFSCYCINGDSIYCKSQICLITSFKPFLMHF